jgi:hypothetical protein
MIPSAESLGCAGNRRKGFSGGARRDSAISVFICRRNA